ncbi:hypothetical protein OE88DRAFT_1103760 [Heliocybe sulcata]|uniref:Uncharacterized protein n=1 Tax=Heliocybe sulcata TaxID=5364 RepID=A0A5C3MK82_9AGAM|nr:hypothetical protein OE88DRAFT_1103760 [Heliocybe sulcata]
MNTLIPDPYATTPLFMPPELNIQGIIKHSRMATIKPTYPYSAPVNNELHYACFTTTSSSPYIPSPSHGRPGDLWLNLSESAPSIHFKTENNTWTLWTRVFYDSLPEHPWAVAYLHAGTGTRRWGLTWHCIKNLSLGRRKLEDAGVTSGADIALNIYKQSSSKAKKHQGNVRAQSARRATPYVHLSNGHHIQLITYAQEC